MTPEQKEAVRRAEALLQDAAVGLHLPYGLAGDLRDILDALAASQPASATEPNFAQCCASTNVAGCDCVNKDHIHLDLDPPRTQPAADPVMANAADMARHAKLWDDFRDSIIPRQHPKPAPDADTGQVDEVEALRKALHGFTQGNGDLMEARRLLGDRTYAAADTGQAVALLDEAQELAVSAIKRMRAAHVDCLALTMRTEEFLRNVAAARKAHPTPPAADTGQAVAWDVSTQESDGRTWLKLRRSDGASAMLSCKSRIDCGNETIVSQVIKAFATDYTHPAPLDAERVREDYADKLFADACKPVSEGGPGAFMDIASWIKRQGAMLPADRAALRQKEGN